MDENNFLMEEILMRNIGEADSEDESDSDDDSSVGVDEPSPRCRLRCLRATSATNSLPSKALLWHTLM